MEQDIGDCAYWTSALATDGRRFLFHVNPEDVSKNCDEAVRRDLFTLSERVGRYRVTEPEALTDRNSSEPLSVSINDTCLIIEKLE
jgi:hypothetical protein